MSLKQRLDSVRQRIEVSARAAGRDPATVTLVAAVKEQPIEALYELFDLGVRDFGENTVQSLCSNAQLMTASGRREVRWHFIGRLQRNKVNKLLPYLPIVHTVDDELAAVLEQRVPEQGVDVLVQVNIGCEPQKGGVAPERALEVARAVARSRKLRLLGLMGMPPFGVDPRPFFERLEALSRELQQTPEGAKANALSMGMSDDFETAVACGATFVRVGTALFGART